MIGPPKLMLWDVQAAEWPFHNIPVPGSSLHFRAGSWMGWPGDTVSLSPPGRPTEVMRRLRETVLREADG